jgi:hypothetical protein
MTGNRPRVSLLKTFLPITRPERGFEPKQCRECRHWEFPRFPEDKIEEWDVRTCWLFSDENHSPFEIDWDGSRAVDNITLGTAPDFSCGLWEERND